jgi:cysteine synthase A
MKVFENNAQTIGNTPLVKIHKMHTGGNLLAKIESRNPAGSVKCRIGYSMIRSAEKSGQLQPGKTIVEPTSGNTGIALAFVAAAKGYKVILTMPDSMSIERRKMLKIFGAELVLTEAAKGMPGAIAAAEALVASNPDQYIYLKQFSNPANPKIHAETTGPEIWADTDGAVDVVVAGVGTGGTLTGVGRHLKQTRGKAVHMVAVEPAASPVISQTLAGEPLKPSPHKIQGIGAGFVPDNLDLDMVDEVIQVSNEDAIATARRLALEEGLPSGISCGAAMTAALEVARRPDMADRKIVVILPDSGERYLSTALFEGLFDNKGL